MDFRDIKRLVHSGENSTVEFKRKVRHPEKIVREIVAFANTDGGKLLIGVDDNGTIPGIRFFEDEDFIMQNAIKELCRPKIDYKTHFVKLRDDRFVIMYDIGKSEHKPHFALMEKTHHYGKAYVRIEDRTVQASKELRTILKLQSHQTSPGFSYGDNEKLLMNYLEDHGNITLEKYSDISTLTHKRASEILINLALNNVIRIIPGEGEDHYVFPH